MFLYITPLVLVCWAALVQITGSDLTVIGLLAVAVAVILQCRALVHKYKGKNEKAKHFKA